MPASKNELLSQVNLFASLTPEELEAVAQRILVRQFTQGEVLFREGEDCYGLYILGQGSVKIYKTSPAGREITLAVETAPSSVAEVPLFDGGPYPATVSAITEVVAYLISKQDFRQVCRQHPEVALKVLAVVGRRLRQLVGIVESVSFGSVRQRLARTLLDIHQSQGTNPFPFSLTHQELASTLGTVREVISRNLSRFQTEGLLKIQKKEILLVDADGLEREAETEF